MDLGLNAVYYIFLMEGADGWAPLLFGALPDDLAVGQDLDEYR